MTIKKSVKRKFGKKKVKVAPTSTSIHSNKKKVVLTDTEVLPAPVKKKKKKTAAVSDEPGNNQANSVPAKGTLAYEAKKARDRADKPNRHTDDGYSEDDYPIRSQQRPAEYEPRTDPHVTPRRSTLRDIWERRFFTMLNQITNQRCRAHCELEALRDNFRGDKVKHYKEIVEIWQRIYTDACEHEHELMRLVTVEFPGFKPPMSVLNWPHIVSKPPDMTLAVKEIHGSKYVDGKQA